MEEALNNEVLWARDLVDNLGQVLADQEDRQEKDLVVQVDPASGLTLLPRYSFVVQRPAAGKTKLK